MTFRRPCFPLLAGVAIRFRMFFCCGFCDSVPGGWGSLRFGANEILRFVFRHRPERQAMPFSCNSRFLFLVQRHCSFFCAGIFCSRLELCAGCRAADRRMPPDARAVQKGFPYPVSSVLCAVVGYGYCFFMYTLCAPRPRLPMPDVSSSRQRRSSLAAVLRSKPVSWQ